jgi:adenylate cyclase
MTTMNKATRGDLPGEIRSLVDWLIDGGRTVYQPQDLLAELCQRLVAAGLPLHRVALFVRTLHPNVMGRRFLWKPETGVEVTEAPYDFLETDTFQKSPLPAVIRTGRPIRRRLADPDCPRDFVILGELAAGGVTDYLIDPLDFSDGQVHAAAWTTTRAGGFADADLAALAAIRAPLARMAEIYGLRRVAATLLDTYVGRSSGERILQGRIRRGDIERIGAVLLLSDLRGFTTQSNRLPGEQVIGLLNAYFDGLVPAIEAEGGEVLKFLGDGLLAIFPVAAAPARACAAALAAVAAARTALAEANAARQTRAEPPLRYGLALHLGEVLYGNVGSATRLDFTTIGPAVNLTARLETLARDLGRELVLSAAFAAHCPGAVRSLGRFELRGFREPQEVFTLR